MTIESHFSFIFSVNLVNFLKQSYAWEIDSLFATQEIAVFAEPDDTLSCTQIPATCPVLNQMNPVHIFQYCVFKIYFNGTKLS
jgi:hypothetical protein